jgi:O-antigen ligase
MKDVNTKVSVAVLGVLPWLMPFTAGPVPSVLPWLCCAVATAMALLIDVRSHGGSWRMSLSPRIGWTLAGPVFVLFLAIWPRARFPYEWLALCGGLCLIALGAALSRVPSALSANGRPRGVARALWPWLAAGLISSVFALLQYTDHAAPLAPWVNWAPPGEAFANLRQRNQFASLTNIAVAALLAWRVLPRRHSEPSTGAELGLAGALALLAVGNAASASRTGLLQLLVLAAVMMLWRRERRVVLWLAWVMVCYAIGSVGLPWSMGFDPASHGMLSRLGVGDALCSSRITLWRNVLHLISLKPWLGWGWGELDYAHYMTLYDGPRFCDILDNAHTLPLHLAVELGVPAAVLFCGACVWIVWAQRPWREADPTRQLAWMVLAVLAVHSLLEYPLWYGPFQLAAGLCVGMLWHGDARRAHKATRSVLPVVLAVWMLSACAYAAWDYRRISQIYLPPEQRLPQYQADTYEQARRSWLFAQQVRFAELSISTVTPDNAAQIHVLATELLHFSPEAKVVEKLLDSALLLGLHDEVRAHAERFEAAFPEAYARWTARQRMP